MKKNSILLLLLLSAIFLNQSCKNQDSIRGTRVIPVENPVIYEDNRPSAKFRLDAKDEGIVLKHGQGPDSCDYLNMKSHMNRDIGLAWIDLPIHLPEKK